jgi:NADH-quinone oxidoreductase subunit N
MKLILVLTGLGVLVLLAEIFRLRKILFPLVLLGLLGAIATAAAYWYYDDGSLAGYLNGMVDNNHHIPSNPEGHWYARMIEFGPSSILFSIVMLVTAVFWLFMSRSFFTNESSESDHYALVIFALVGAVILTCYSNMVMLFLGVEILSIPLYVLAGSRKDDLASNESSFKYFIMGSFASAFLLFGIALVYGATGSFDLNQIAVAVIKGTGPFSTLLYAGIVMMLVGMLFKVSAAPFHFWAPDVYSGAPTPVTAFMSTIVKTAAIVAIIRLFLGPTFGHVDSFWSPLIGVCVALTIIVGNVTAVAQTGVKRMLAYSSISHAGFLLLAVASYNSGMAVNISAKTILYYTAAYSVGSITAFTVLINIMEQTGSDLVSSFNGLGKKNPLLAVAMTIALLSLAGIPPTAGFFAKYYVFTAALTNGHGWLVMIAILGSLVGVYYYFRIIIAMFFKPAENDQPIVASSEHQALLFITAVIVIVLGLLPDLLLNLGTVSAPVAAH